MEFVDYNWDLGPDYLAIDPDGNFYNPEDVLDEILDENSTSNNTAATATGKFDDSFTEPSKTHDTFVSVPESDPSNAFSMFEDAVMDYHANDRPTIAATEVGHHQTGSNHDQATGEVSTATINHVSNAVPVDMSVTCSHPNGQRELIPELGARYEPTTVAPSCFTNGTPTLSAPQSPFSGSAFGVPQNSYATPNSTACEVSQQPSGPPLLRVAPRLPGGSQHYRKLGGCRCGKDIIKNGHSDGHYCTWCFNQVNKEITYAWEKARQNVPNSQTTLDVTSRRIVTPPASAAPPPPAQAMGYRSILTKGMGGVSAEAAANYMPSYAGLGIACVDDNAQPVEHSASQTSHSFFPATHFGPSSMPLTHARDAGELQLPSPSNTSSSATLDAPVEGEEEDQLVLEHASAEAALAYIFRPPASVCQHLDFENDDWQQLKGPMFDQTCVRLFKALSKPGDPPPEYFLATEKAYFIPNHERTHRTVLSQLETADQIKLAKAHVILTIDEVVYLHEKGVPNTVLKGNNARTHKGFAVDESLKATERAELVIEYARSNKYIALDIISGKNTSDMVRNPKLYLERKWSNAQTNSGRADDMKAVNKLKKGESVDQVNAADLLKPRKRGRKGKNAAASPAPMTQKRARGISDDIEQNIDQESSKRARVQVREDDAIVGNEVVGNGGDFNWFLNSHVPSNMEVFGRELAPEGRDSMWKSW